MLVCYDCGNIKIDRIEGFCPKCNSDKIFDDEDDLLEEKILERAFIDHDIDTLALYILS